MDQMPDSNDGFANTNLFANSQQYNSYDNLNLFQNGPDPNFNDASWGVNASDYPSNPAVSRGQQPAPGWQSTHHLSAPSSFNGRSSPYGRTLNHSPLPYSANGFASYGNQAGQFTYQQQQQQQPPQSQAQPPPTQHLQHSQHPQHQQTLLQQQQHQQQQLQQRQQQQPHRHQQQQAQYDYTLGGSSGSGQNFNVGLGGFSSATPNSRTIAPQSLEHERQQSNFANHGLTNNTFPPASSFPQTRPNTIPSLATRVPVAEQHVLQSAIPRGLQAELFYITNFDDLTRETKSERMSSFLNIGKQALEWNVTRSAIPTYTARKSRNDLKRLAGTNESILARIGKKSSKSKSASSAPKVAKIRSVPASVSVDGEVKYEQVSSSEEDSSDDDSSYSEDSDYDSPLPTKRPDSPRGSIEYDTIKALWRSKRRPVDSETIRKALVDFWEIVKTIRDRWKVDAAAVNEAEEKKRTGELPLLKSRVKDQRDMIEAAFKAALKHGHRAIVELLSENVSLLFVCYQFLLDRFKDDDVNGNVSRAILETMSIFTTLTESKLEKTHIAKVLPRYQKKGDAKTQYWVKKIQANIEAATKEATGKAPGGQQDTKKPLAASLESNKPSPPAAKRPVPEPVAGVKRAASIAAEGSATKKVATNVAKPANLTNGIKPNGAVKKTPTAADRAPKPAGAVATTSVKKTVIAKPSGFFSNLQSAAKKPGTAISDKPTANTSGRPTPGKGMTGPPTATPKPAFSFAETMANLSKPKEERVVAKAEKAAPPETPEQREKRLRKEERRKLHVIFKSGDDLVQVRYFVHDPSEEVDHTSSQMRDVADVGGEGRMFKQQHNMMDIDDEDEIAEEMERLIDFRPPSNVDFTVVDTEERKRNYARYGGGELEVDSPERTVREAYEKTTLMVVYTDPSEIPANPREPVDPYNGPESGEVRHFGDPDDKAKYTQRANARRSAPPRPTNAPTYTSAGANGSNFLQQPLQGIQAGALPQAAPTSNPDIKSILDALAQSTQTQTPPAPSQPTYNPTYTAPPMVPEPQSQPNSSAVNGLASLDLAAILASLNGNSSGGGNHGHQAPSAVASQPPSLMGFAPQMQQAATFGSAGDGQQEEEELTRLRTKNPFYKTKVCRFWQEGRCQKGSNCSYLHE